MQRWQIGDVRVTRIVESEGPVPPAFPFAAPDAAAVGAHAAWLAPHVILPPESICPLTGTHCASPAARRVEGHGSAWRFADGWRGKARPRSRAPSPTSRARSSSS
jgi:hypothetical protein